MTEKSNCYLCTSEASCKVIPEEHDEWIDVLCQGNCSRYIITETAIKELTNNQNRKNEIIAQIKIISKTGKTPLIRYDVIKKEFILTTKEEQ